MVSVLKCSDLSWCLCRSFWAQACFKELESSEIHRYLHNRSVVIIASCLVPHGDTVRCTSVVYTQHYMFSFTLELQ